MRNFFCQHFMNSGIMDKDLDPELQGLYFDVAMRS